MNFYKRHIGDYIKATAHLSLLEHGVYTRLLDVYYTRESGIPEDQAARLIGARTKEEKAALVSVLEEFFVVGQDRVWRQSRCDEEILDAAEFGEEREARAENEKERQRRHRAERKLIFETLRSNGIVPPYDTKTNALRDMLSRVTGASQVTPVTCTATAIQTPQATSQTPQASRERRASAPATKPVASKRMPVEYKPSAELLEWAKTKHPDVDFNAQLEMVRDHQFERAYSEWDSVVRNWIRRAPQFAPKLNGHSAPMRSITPIDPDGNDKKTIAKMLSQGATDAQIFEALDCMRSHDWINQRKREIANEQH